MNNKIFPNWFINILTFLGIIFLFLFCNKIIENILLFQLVLWYPIILLSIYFFDSWKYEEYDGWKYEKTEVPNSQYFFNISIFIVCFITLLLIINFKEYIRFIEKLINSRFTILLSNYIDIQKSKNDYSFWSLPLYFSMLIYFILVSIYLSKKIKIAIDSEK